jgi:hypothetical protein
VSRCRVRRAMAVGSQIITASEEVPLLSMLLKLDMAVVRGILCQEEFQRPEGVVRPFHFGHGACITALGNNFGLTYNGLTVLLALCRQAIRHKDGKPTIRHRDGESVNSAALHRVYIGRRPFSAKAPSQAESQPAPDLSERPQLAVRRVNKFLGDQPERTFRVRRSRS